MKRIFAALLALITLFGVFSMTSCGKKDGIPKGMQLVRGGSEVGYNFYGPEEWIVANYGDISCTYASKIDMSSMTFTETVKPEGTIKEYFESEKTKFPYEINVTVDGEDCNFGNAFGAKKYVYTYTYKTFSYTCMQIFVIRNDKFYIFTYTASNTQRNDSDKSYYEYYLDKVQATIEAFTFTEKTANASTPEYERDAEGYKLISDKVIAGFKMYVPDSFNVDYSSALVSATHQDGTNINMSRATISAYSNDYWTERKANIEAFADKVPEGEGGALVTSLKQIGDKPTELELDDVIWALAYEYTYVFEGVQYHVYQVHIVVSRQDGYVFTYIATEENYEAHIEEMKKVLDKLEY